MYAMALIEEIILTVAWKCLAATGMVLLLGGALALAGGYAERRLRRLVRSVGGIRQIHRWRDFWEKNQPRVHHKRRRGGGVNRIDTP